MTHIAPHVTAWLRQRLPVARAASQHTCDTYAYAFQLLLHFARQKVSTPPSALQLEHIDAPFGLECLEYLQQGRGNAPRTRHARLTAITSCMHFVAYRVPSALDQVNRVLAIPNQKTDIRLVDHLSAEQCQALLDNPAPPTRLAIRARAMLHVSIAAGLRGAELVGLRLSDVSCEARYLNLPVCGKGRQNRLRTLWRPVAESGRAWRAVRGEAMVPELFLNARGKAMTRAGFAYLLRKHATEASRRCPSRHGIRLSPHVLRHTCALNILQATGDIRKVALWLGHERIQTTEDYLRVDVTQSIGILHTGTPPQLRPGKFRPPDQLIASLRG
jgi:integrase/recombinase XerD